MVLKKLGATERDKVCSLPAFISMAITKYFFIFRPPQATKIVSLPLKKVQHKFNKQPNSTVNNDSGGNHATLDPLVLPISDSGYDFAVCFSAATLRAWLSLLSAILGNFITAYNIVTCYVGYPISL